MKERQSSPNNRQVITDSAGENLGRRGEREGGRRRGTEKDREREGGEGEGEGLRKRKIERGRGGGGGGGGENRE